MSSKPTSTSSASSSTPPTSSSSSQPPVGSITRGVDMEKMLLEDYIFLADCRRSLFIYSGSGTVLGGGALFALMRRTGGSPLKQAGAALLGGVGGFTAGLLKVSSDTPAKIAALPNNSQFKKWGTRILADRYPMAMADAMEQRKASAGQPTPAASTSAPKK